MFLKQKNSYLTAFSRDCIGLYLSTYLVPKINDITFESKSAPTLEPPFLIDLK